MEDSVNLYLNGGFINLGLERMKELYKSNDCLELLTEKLGLFNIKLSIDAVCYTTDGASVMGKMAMTLLLNTNFVLLMQ